MSVYAVSISSVRALASTSLPGLTFTCRIYLPVPSNRPTGSTSSAPRPEKTDIDVRCEYVDVGECCVSYTCGRMAVMQYFSNIVSTFAHDLKPVVRDSPQVTRMILRMILHPSIDGRIPFD